MFAIFVIKKTMNRLFTLSLLFLLFIGCQSNQLDNKNTQDESGGKAFDSALSVQLGADEYGMKQYVMAILKRGPNREMDSATAATIQNAHLANIGRMAAEGKLVLAGPFLDEGDIRGIYIFDVRTFEEAQELTQSDPAIKSGRLVMELHPWYGSAAIMQVNEEHSKLAKINIF